VAFSYRRALYSIALAQLTVNFINTVVQIIAQNGDTQTETLHTLGVTELDKNDELASVDLNAMTVMSKSYG